MDKAEEAIRVFNTEIDALVKTRDSLGDVYIQILDSIISCKGKVIVTGMGKPGHIGRKIAATFSSLGTPSFYMHPAEAMHGDLGMVTRDDVVIAISYSGESEEILQILPIIKLIGAKLIAITGNAGSILAKTADIVQVLPKFDEAGPLGLAPTSSTTVELVLGDALAVCASILYGFREADFGKLHPAGSLGKKLILRVCDLMTKGEDIPRVERGTILMDAIPIMSKKALGMVTIVDADGKLNGLITDGDLRRIIERRIDIYAERVDNVMTRSPVVVPSDILAVDALRIINNREILALPVVDSDMHLMGVIHFQQIINAGIVL